VQISANNEKSDLLFSNFLRFLTSEIKWKEKEEEKNADAIESNGFEEEVIYRCFLKYCKFNIMCPLYKKLSDICDNKSASKNVDDNNDDDDNDDILEDLESFEKRKEIKFEKDYTIEEKISLLK
jgi:hypothetical protein